LSQAAGGQSGSIAQLSEAAGKGGNVDVLA
jgi:hypothetical protein